MYVEACMHAFVSRCKAALIMSQVCAADGTPHEPGSMASPILGCGTLRASLLGTPARPRQIRSPVPLHIVLGASSTGNGVAAHTNAMPCPALLWSRSLARCKGVLCRDKRLIQVSWKVLRMQPGMDVKARVAWGLGTTGVRLR